MKKIILMSVFSIIFATGVFASEGKYSEGEYLVPKTKVIPKRSDLFEPNNAIEEDDEDQSAEDSNTMVLVDVEKESERFDSVSPTEKYRLMSPWQTQTNVQPNDLVSDIEAIIQNGTKEELTSFLQGKNLRTMKDFYDNPLYVAIWFDKTDMIAPLAAAGADVSLKDENGHDFKYYALKDGSQAMVQEFLKVEAQAKKAQVQQDINLGKKSPYIRTASVSPLWIDDSRK